MGDVAKSYHLMRTKFTSQNFNTSRFVFPSLGQIKLSLGEIILKASGFGFFIIIFSLLLF